MFRGEEEITPDIMRIAQHIARSSVSPRNLAILEFMYRSDKELFNRKEIQDAINLPSDTCAMLLENMVALNILEKEVDPDNKPTWKIKPLFKLLTKEANVI